jgi:HSP20 family protein
METTIMTTKELTKRPARETWAFPAFGRFFDDWLGQADWPARGNAALRPAMDVEEDENFFRVRTELPGIPKDDVTITLEDGVLSITGEKRSDRETKEKNYHLVERSFGAFHRSLSLPAGVDAEKADATFENGVLTIAIPKSEAAKPRKLTIK